MKNYTFKEAIEFLKNLPHFVPPKDCGHKASDFFSLDAEYALLEKVGNPHMDLLYVHVGGTNGKGSTSAYIASILKEADYQVGCFTSPFLFAYNEMFRVNGEEISDEDFARIFSDVKVHYDELAANGIFPSEYEILTVMSFLYFREMGCDIVVMEVSLGGRVDTTNVIPTPLVSVITPISYDHMTILGDTLTEIATEKAGIIKPGTKVVSAIQEKEVTDVLAKVCAEKKVELSFISKPALVSRNRDSQEFMVPEFGSRFTTKLLGTYQIYNATLAILAIEKLKASGFFISDYALICGVRNTEWFGRFTFINNEPPVLVDGGHNRQGAAVLAESLKEYFPDKKITFVLGMLKDKEVDTMLDELLPIAEEVYTVSVPNERTMEPEVLADLVQERGVKAQVIKDDKINNLVNQSKDKEDIVITSIEDEPVICIAGSLYLLSSLTVD